MSYPTLTDIQVKPRLLADVPAETQTEALCLAAVEIDGYVLEHVQQQTYAICLMAVQADARALYFVEPEFQTPELCLAAMTVDGLLLRWVETPSPEVCRAAVEQNGHALKYVQQQTPELCLAAVRNEAAALKHVKDQTPAVCMEAVARDGFMLRYVKLPTDRLLEPASRQLQHWREVLDVWRPAGTGLNLEDALRPLTDAMPLGKQYADEWQQPAGDGRLMLDLLSDVARALKRMQPNSDLIARFCQRAGHQIELALNSRRAVAVPPADRIELEGTTL